MYAKNLSLLLHRQLSESLSYDDTLQRFEKLRGYGQLPRGRDRAGQRLTNDEIASAVLGFVPTLVDFAGHVALVMGNLRPVGGVGASFQRAPSLKAAIAELLSQEDSRKSLISLTLSTARNIGNDEYQGKAIFEQDGGRIVTSYVSKYATSLAAIGAEKTFDHDRPLSTNARQLVLDRAFFCNLAREVELSRQLNMPLKTDWLEYETEEQRDAFHKRLGARRHSDFMNLGVDTIVTWPKEPTRIQFGGHHFVLFPKTRTHSHSISIDLKNERISADDARTLLNRFLSLLSWCDDQHAILRDGWSGNPVPSPVLRRDMAFMTMSIWMFYRTMPKDPQLLNCLSYYREGLNAGEAGIASQEVLSFFKVFETEFKEFGRKEIGPKTREWITASFDDACKSVRAEDMDFFHKDRQNKAIAKYIYENCRVATAHASKDYPSDADLSSETRRLIVAAKIIKALARYYIKTTYQLSDSYLSNE